MTWSRVLSERGERGAFPRKIVSLVEDAHESVGDRRIDR
jgi:hypothetical protein